MNTPFTKTQFFQVFEDYNSAVFPAQIVIAAIALALWLGIVQHNHSSQRWTALFLGTLWIWTGVVYQMLFFSAINPVANAFGVLFVVEGLLILYDHLRGSLQFETG